MDIFIQKIIKISLSASCCLFNIISRRGLFPLLGPWGLSPSSVVFTTLPGAAQPILADLLPCANISVLLEPGKLGVGNKDSTLFS